MPHAGVQIKFDRGRAVAVLCGSIDIGQGSDSILADAEAKGFGIDPGDTRELTADTELTPVSGEELQASTRQVIEQPPQLIGRVKELLGGNWSGTARLRALTQGWPIS